jgi:hypothetical protein
MQFEFSLGFAIKAVTMLLAAFGVIVGIVRWFILEGHSRFHAFTTGFAVILLCAMLLTCELVTLPFEEHYRYIQTPAGKAAQLGVIGLILGGSPPLWIASWTLFWVLAVIYLLVHFFDIELAPPLLEFGGGTWNPNVSKSQGSAAQPIATGSYAPLE